MTLPWCGPSLLIAGSRLYSALLGDLAALIGAPPSSVSLSSATCPSLTTGSAVQLQVGVPMVLTIIFKNVSSISAAAQSLVYDVETPEAVVTAVSASLPSWYKAPPPSSLAGLGGGQLVASLTSTLLGVAIGGALGCQFNAAGGNQTNSGNQTSAPAQAASGAAAPVPLSNFVSSFDVVASQNGASGTQAYACRPGTVSTSYLVTSNLGAAAGASAPNALPNSSVAGIVIGALLIALIIAILLIYMRRKLCARGKSASPLSTQVPAVSIEAAAAARKELEDPIDHITLTSSAIGGADERIDERRSPLSPESDAGTTFSVANPLASSVWASPLRRGPISSAGLGPDTAVNFAALLPPGSIVSSSSVMKEGQEQGFSSNNPAYSHARGGEASTDDSRSERPLNDASFPSSRGGTDSVELNLVLGDVPGPPSVPPTPFAGLPFAAATGPGTDEHRAKPPRKIRGGGSARF